MPNTPHPMHIRDAKNWPTKQQAHVDIELMNSQHAPGGCHEHLQVAEAAIALGMHAHQHTSIHQQSILKKEACMQLAAAPWLP